jgi:hypothetical protein
MVYGYRGGVLRTEIAPNRKVHTQKSPAPPDVSLCVVTHYTEHLYHKDRMEIVKLCIDSMLAGAQGHKTELIIWDNASTPAFRVLLKSYNPTVYVESLNIGGYNGRRAMLALARGRYTCITDDDVLFRPGWLGLQLKLLETYPMIAAACGSPRPYHASAAGLERCNVRTGFMLPADWLSDLSVSVGVAPGGADRGRDMLVDHEGVRAWVVHCDMQMLGKTNTLKLFHEDYCEYIGTSGGVCNAMKEANRVQLATVQRTCVHIGNKIDKTVLSIQTQFNNPYREPTIEIKQATWLFKEKK